MLRCGPTWAMASSFIGFLDHTQTHHCRKDSSARMISSSQRPLPDNTQQAQQTEIHAPGGIRTRNPSKRAAADLRLRLRGHWDRQWDYVLTESILTDAYDTAHPKVNQLLLSSEVIAVLFIKN
jgi:hypothetical protein